MLNLIAIAAMALATPEAAPAETAPAAQTAAAKPAGDPAKQRLICKRQTTVGSLVAYKRVCLTAKDWELANQAGQEAARGAVDSCRMRAEGGGC